MMDAQTDFRLHNNITVVVAHIKIKCQQFEFNENIKSHNSAILNYSQNDRNELIFETFIV